MWWGLCLLGGAWPVGGWAAEPAEAPDAALLEFLGEWRMNDGRWQNPFDIDSTPAPRAGDGRASRPRVTEPAPKATPEEPSPMPGPGITTNESTGRSRE